MEHTIAAAVPLVFPVFSGVLGAGLLIVVFVYGAFTVSRFERENPDKAGKNSEYPFFALAALAAPLLALVAGLYISG
tara:strand:+ start:145 stop:375 length:231 start_codon:yes stop_codon:yes gene_type:complete